MKKAPLPLVLVCLTFAACSEDHPAPCDTCTSATAQQFSDCFAGACASLCGSLDVEDCMVAFPDMSEPILGCVDVCDGCFTGLSCAPCQGTDCPADPPVERCAAFNGMTTCADGVYTGTNG